MPSRIFLMMHFVPPYENWNVDFLDSMSLSLQSNKVSPDNRFPKSKVFSLDLWKVTGFKSINNKT